MLISWDMMGENKKGFESKADKRSTLAHKTSVGEAALQEDEDELSGHHFDRDYTIVALNKSSVYCMPTWQRV